MVDAAAGSGRAHARHTTLTKEVANVWSVRVGPADQPAPAVHVQSLFNELHLYPTKTQVFEMLVCARQCTRRKSLSLTFGEFCVFAAELSKCARRAKQTSSKPPDSPYKCDSSRDKEGPRVLNGSEASPPPVPPPQPCEVFLGGSCNPTTWRSEIAIPMLEEMGITYFNPQVAEWSLELVEVESRAKQAARALLFVLDSETRAVAASVEAAQLAALPRDLLLVLRPYKRGQRIGNETISDQEYVELSRARATLQEAVERRGLPAFSDITSALHCARTVLRGARTHPRQPLGHTILRLKRAFDAAGGSSAARVTRTRAVDAAAELARVSRQLADNSLPPTDSLDFEGFCAAVAELTADQEGSWSNGSATTPTSERCAPAPAHTPTNGLHRHDSNEKSYNGYQHKYNSRLKACGKKLSLIIPKSGSNCSVGSEEADTSVFTPGTQQRLEQLPAMLGASPSPAPASSPSPAAAPSAPASPGASPQTYMYDVYLGGSLPKCNPRIEERLRSAGVRHVVPRVNDYTRMFSTPCRRAAASHPDSPRADKKPRPAAHPDSPRADKKLRVADQVQLREKENALEPADRLSASDFYTVTHDSTPQPFKGTYDEELLWRSRVLLFSISSEAPCLSAMILAAHYMELRPRAAVLLVQNLERTQQLSDNAVKDYNRGRHYLRDLAKRSGVPVLDSAEDALACVLDKLRQAQ